jgi:superfamily II DNA or RNA helicase
MAEAAPATPSVGEWLHSEELGETVRVVDVQTLWGVTTCQVWAPSRGQVVAVPAESLSPPQPSEQNLLDRIVYRASAVRIADALAQNVLLSPLEAGVIPLPHQLAALSRAVSDSKVRYLLADEVGLGKTIEAGLILRELKLRGLVERTLVVVPKGLMPQWVTEMQLHFGEEFQPVIPSDFTGYRELLGDENIWRRFDQVVCPADSVKPMEGRKGWSRERVERHNQERVGDLVAAGWDLIIVDEAHRLGGSTEQVARHKLGKELADAAPYMLFLSATPHQGKSDAFHRLMSLLDEDAFPGLDSIRREKVAPFVIRTEKRRAIDHNGEDLFQPRTTELVRVRWGAKHSQQEQLYEAVTDYVREGYNQAMQEKRNYLGFLMILMQRLVTSSTRAIATSLEKRLATLLGEDEDGPASGNDTSWYDQDGQEQLERALSMRVAGLANEIDEVKTLLELAQRCEAQGADARAEALLDLMYEEQSNENDPDLKFLVFTEFVPTQEMLSEFLRDHGFKVVLLNGTMSLEQRQQAQRQFSEDARILVSTDAGGEGLNLQFAHIVVNYDLPWNPMKVEQRIGRVDRIGQTEPVKAYNMLFEDSVELRVHEVLQQKLQVILEEFGVDKTADVLDAEEGGSVFEQAIAAAILNPDDIEGTVDEAVQRVRQAAQNERAGRSMYDEMPLDADAARRVQNHPIQHWIAQMVTSHVKAKGGKVEPKLAGYDLTWPDGTTMRDVCFNGHEAVEWGLNHLSFRDERVRTLVEDVPVKSPSDDVPTVYMDGLPEGIAGYWGLYQVALRSGGKEQVRAMSLFCNDDGRTLLPTARLIWDKLIEASGQLTVGNVETAKGVWERLRAEAERQGLGLFEELRQQHQERLRREREKGEYAFEVRRKAINRIGLPEVRDYRLRRLEQEQREWAADLNAQETVLPELRAVLLLRVEPHE